MEIKIEKKDDLTIISLVGRLDTISAEELKNEIVPLIKNGGKKIIFNFVNLDYISSAGLRILLVATKMMKEKEGLLILCNINDFINEIFEISGFNQILSITNTFEEALVSIKI